MLRSAWSGNWLMFELLKSQGMQQNQQVEFLSDGGEDVGNNYT
jgi:hypothetical protein